jgi:integrase
MKGGREHRVPLCKRAVQIAEVMQAARVSEFVFPGSKPGQPLSVMALEMALRRAQVDATVHGFRSSFRDWSGERTAFPRDVAEAALAHLVGDETERAYRRGDALEKRRALMDAWGSFCADADRGRVVKFSGRRRPTSKDSKPRPSA